MYYVQGKENEELTFDIIPALKDRNFHRAQRWQNLVRSNHGLSSVDDIRTHCRSLWWQSPAAGHGERTRRPVNPGSPEGDAGYPACEAPEGIH
jgi:hypothetical protein